MGTFERIRQISPYLFGVFAVLLIAYFIFTSGGEELTRQSIGNPQTAAIGTVNGEDILRMDFESRVRQEVERQRNQKLQENPEAEVEIDEKQIRNQIWEQMISETLLRQYSEKAGIFVTDEELRDLFIESPPDFIKRQFTDSAGNFMKQVYLDILTNPENLVNYMAQDPSQISPEERQKAIQDWRQNLIKMTNILRDQKLNENLGIMVNSASSIISPNYAHERYLAENSEANVDFVFYNVQSIGDNEVKVSDSELKDYYEKHKKYYKQDPQRKIKYVSFRILPSGQDTINAEKKINRISKALNLGQNIVERDSIFDNMLDQFNGTTEDFQLVKDMDKKKLSILMGLEEREVAGPLKINNETYFLRLDAKREGENEVVKASHILIKFGTDKDSAKAEIMKIMQEAKAGGNFAELASKHSADPGSARQGGDLGYFGKGQMVKPFEEAAFSANVGDITGPIETQYGYHILSIDDKKSEEVAYSEIKIAPRVSSVTKNILMRNALSFYKQVEEGANFDTLAKKLDVRVNPTGFFERKRPILGSRYLTDLVFQKSAGEVLEPIELEFFGIVVVQVDEERQAGIKPFEDVKAEVERKVIKIKKLNLLKSKADKLYSSIKGSSTLDAAINVDPSLELKSAPKMKNDGVVPTAGNEFAVTSKAFEIPLGKVSEPIRGENGYFLIVVHNRTVPDKSEVERELAGYVQELKTKTQQAAFFQWFRKLKDVADIVDMRYKYYTDY